MFIEITRYRLRPGVNEPAFVDADHRLQTQFMANHGGLIRRTTARDGAGHWVTITLWQAEADADASNGESESHPVAQAWNDLVELSSREATGYSTLD